MTVKQLLKEHGIRQENLAEVLDKAQSTVSQMLSGKTRISFEDACVIADLLGISTDDLRNVLAEEFPEYRPSARLQTTLI